MQIPDRQFNELTTALASLTPTLDVLPGRLAQEFLDLLREERLIWPDSDPGWDEQSWFAKLLEKRGEDETRAARDLYEWTRARSWWQSFRASQGGTWRPLLLVDRREYSPIALSTSGTIRVLFRMFDAYETRLELLRRVYRIPHIPSPPDASTKPSMDFRLRVLAHDNAALEQFKDVLEWIEAEVEETA